MNSLADLPERYRIVLCDVWGCVHDGVKLFEGGGDLLRSWRRDGRTVLLITNAPRPGSAVAEQLDRLGLARDAWDAIVTSGEAGIASLDKNEEIGFIGTERDRELILDAGVKLAEGPSGEQVVCTGLNAAKPEVEDWEPDLRSMRERGACMLCFNPDRVVVRGSNLEPCAGALADRYLELGGEVSWFGKPHPPIYAHSLRVAGERLGRTVEKREVVAIGDGMRTDMLGAARAGLDFVFITGGIEAEAAEEEGAQVLLDGFREEHALPDFEPVAIRERLC